MHEYSAACSVVESAVETARKHGARRVTGVSVDVGEFTFLVPEQLRFNFEIAAKDTIVEGATLNIRVTKGRLLCRECGYEGETSTDSAFPPTIAPFMPMKCARCSSSATTIVGGREFIITSIEAEVPTQQ
ncbi:MAG: hydrogenase maturation nickel metallochaperone HypA [Candidatus Thorarchaeota archaeon]